ncbi:3-alpha-hydroxysteroid dehydrogenase [Glutamicibacter uratoxydans]|uniref:3-alpha-hydroxysteroid dehydrogenase n=1 Tax=Glutamicibacter uratoxydans TaxID=43667 RepID=A0A4Y4DNG7_GLUUR|nr:SDR family oxidoreductase [Glutamicibacter uratoxydans]GED05205.1 3-alpha-hydroxysteroid dehydrogenase [Glutamicibacter uratoxydans]
MRLAGKRALITGAAKGMGAAHARAFIEAGAQVLLADVDDGAGAALAKELGASYIHLDVTRATDWDAAVARAASEFGGLDVLVNNAGIFAQAPLEDTTDEVWQRVLNINLTSAFLGMRAAAGELKKSGNASIINVSSTAGLEGYPGQHAYAASKWGLRGVTKTAALELAEFGVRVNSLHPGAIATPLITAFREVTEEDLSGNTLERFARPEEVTGLMVFLASDESSFCTGAEYVVDGGITAGTRY